MKNDTSTKITEFWQWLEQSKEIPYGDDICRALSSLIKTVFDNLKETISSDDESHELKSILEFLEKFITSKYGDSSSKNDHPNSLSIIARQVLSLWESTCKNNNLSDAAESLVFEFSVKYLIDTEDIKWRMLEIAAINVKKKHYERAEKYYEVCWDEKIYKNDIVRRSECLINLKYYQKGASILTQAVEDYPDSPEILCDLGTCLYQLEDYKKSSEAFNNVIKMEEAKKANNFIYYKHALNQRANCFIKMNDIWRALFQFNQILSVNDQSDREVEQIANILSYLSR